MPGRGLQVLTGPLSASTQSGRLDPVSVRGGKEWGGQVAEGTSTWPPRVLPDRCRSAVLAPGEVVVTVTALAHNDLLRYGWPRSAKITMRKMVLPVHDGWLQSCARNL